MKNNKMKFEDFATDVLTKTQQKAVRGGDETPIDPKNDPSKGGNNGNG
ncbi:rSAM-modified peptide [Flavobacterium cutihirudinis]|nr:rSAM-modified peptide [Flavobacterium cutihirudinis]